MKKIIIGRLGKTYGVKGWLHLNSYTDPIDKILEYPEWQLEHQKEWKAFKIEDAKKHGAGIIIKLPGIENPETARLYTNDTIAIERITLPTPQENEYYWEDLIGLTVQNTQQITLGTVSEVQATGANEILIITNEKKRHLIPFIKHTIQAVDLPNKLITVDWDDAF